MSFKDIEIGAMIYHARYNERGIVIEVHKTYRYSSTGWIDHVTVMLEGHSRAIKVYPLSDDRKNIFVPGDRVIPGYSNSTLKEKGPYKFVAYVNHNPKSINKFVVRNRFNEISYTNKIKHYEPKQHNLFEDSVKEEMKDKLDNLTMESIINELADKLLDKFEHRYYIEKEEI